MGLLEDDLIIYTPIIKTHTILKISKTAQAVHKNDISILEMSKSASYNFRSIYRKEF